MFENDYLFENESFLALFVNFVLQTKTVLNLIKKMVANIRKWWVYGVFALLVCLSCLFFCRGALLRYFADARIALIEEHYGLNIQYEGLGIEGLNIIKLRQLSVIPKGRDTLLTLKKLNVHLGMWSLLSGRLRVSDIDLDGLNLFFIKRGTLANYDFLFLPSRKVDDSLNGGEVSKDYVRQTKVFLELLFGLLPENGALRDLRVTERQDGHSVTLHIPLFSVLNNRFRSSVLVREDSLMQSWVIEGELLPSARKVYVSLYAPGHKQIMLPYISRRFGAEVKFDTLGVSLQQESSGRKLAVLAGGAKAYGLQIYHQRLSPEVINLGHCLLDYHVNVMPHCLELDSSSRVRFNALDFNPYLRIERLEGPQQLYHFTASVRKSWFPAQNLFSSLPIGLFGNLQGIRTHGELAYHFLFDVDFSRLDSLKLESDLKARNFHIERFGQTNLNKMSGEFEYTAYENGQPVRSFPIGPSWEHFTPLDSISPLLQMAVMQSEDGAFFYHRGFLPDALREALIYDLKERRFARGGSTISMQLVKNVFLNRNKNIARKLEEALIVWLIENEHLTSKQRMYEVYLNIAEWGPLIYGIKEAAAFYFDKLPSELTLEESIFLASIIPKPKHFRNSFTADGQLKENQEGYFRLIARRLAKKGLISEAEAESIQPVIQLRGPAKEFFVPDQPGQQGQADQSNQSDQPDEE